MSMNLYVSLPTESGGGLAQLGSQNNEKTKRVMTPASNLMAVWAKKTAEK